MLSSSMALQSSMNSTFTCSILPSHSKLNTKPSNPATLINSKPNLIHSPIILELKNSKPISRNQRLVALAAPETLAVETPPEAISTPEEEPIQKAKVVVNQMEKPRLVLKFIWMEKNIGIGLDQKIPGHGTIPLSPYFFWPRKDAWEELKTTLESKPWVSQKKMIILLNQATDIINLWQQSGGNLTN